jgi:hypothetical protein
MSSGAGVNDVSAWGYFRWTAFDRLNMDPFDGYMRYGVTLPCERSVEPLLFIELSPEPHTIHLKISPRLKVVDNLHFTACSVDVVYLYSILRLVP